MVFHHITHTVQPAKSAHIKNATKYITFAVSCLHAFQTYSIIFLML